MARTTTGFFAFTDLIIGTSQLSHVTAIGGDGAIGRLYDTLLPSRDFTWTDAHASATWQNVVNFLAGNETGDIWVIVHDELNSRWGFQVWAYSTATGTVALKNESADYTVGTNTLNVQFQFVGTQLQIANDGNPTAGHYLKAYLRFETTGA
jgi:hypothetical protein